MFGQKSIEAKTAIEVEEIQTESGLRAYLERARLHNPIVNAVLNVAEIRELTPEHTWMLLAYHGLVAAEKNQEAFREHITYCPLVPRMTAPRG